MGFPHSEIPGYKRLPSGLPRLIAAGYVLLRSTESRHPCDAMSNVFHYCCSRVAGPQHLLMRGKERAGCARTCARDYFQFIHVLFIAGDAKEHDVTSSRHTPFCLLQCFIPRMRDKKSGWPMHTRRIRESPRMCGGRILRVGTRKHRASAVYCGETVSQEERGGPACSSAKLTSLFVGRRLLPGRNTLIEAILRLLPRTQ